jgi:hypothetical protein
MSDIFNLSRFGKLMQKQLFENSRLYMFSILALLGLMSIVFGFWLWVGGNTYTEESTYVILFVGLFVSGGIFASMAFNMIGSKDKGIYWLSVPATHFEKLLCTILFHTVFFTIVYLLCFFLIKGIAVSLLQNYISTHPNLVYRRVMSEDGNFFEVMRYIAYTFLAVQALYLLGSIYFPRYSFIITTVIGCLCIFGFVFYMVQMQKALGGSWEITSLRVSDVAGQNSYKEYEVSETTKLVLKRVVQFIWVPVFWTAAWFRLREKQI